MLTEKDSIAHQHIESGYVFSIFSCGCKQYKSIHVNRRQIYDYFFFLVFRKAFFNLNPALILAAPEPCVPRKKSESLGFPSFSAAAFLNTWPFPVIARSISFILITQLIILLCSFSIPDARKMEQSPPTVPKRTSAHASKDEATSTRPTAESNLHKAAGRYQ